jgi:hypothetical protein
MEPVPGALSLVGPSDVAAMVGERGYGRGISGRARSGDAGGDRIGRPGENTREEMGR